MSTQKHTLEIKDLHVTVDTEQGTKEILRGVTLTINSGETHAVMGPNGSGKSTLSYVIAGHPKYEVTEGEVLLDGAQQRVEAALGSSETGADTDSNADAVTSPSNNALVEDGEN